MAENFVNPFEDNFVNPLDKGEDFVDPFAEAPPATPYEAVNKIAIGGGGEKPMLDKLGKDISTWPERLWESHKQIVGGLLQEFGTPQNTIMGVIPFDPNTPPEPGPISTLFGRKKLSQEEWDKRREDIDKKFPEVPKLETPETAKTLQETGEYMYKAADQRLKEITPPDESFLSQAGFTAIDSFKNAAPGIIARNPAVMLGAFGLAEHGRDYGEAIAAGKTPTEARRIADVKTTIELGTEAISAPTLFVKYPNLGTKFINFMARELPGENIAEFSQMYVDWMEGLRPDVTWPEILHTFALVNTSTIIGGGFQAGTVHGLDTMTKVIEARRSDAKLKRVSEETGIPADQIIGPFNKLPERYLDFYSKTRDELLGVKLREEVAHLKLQEIVDNSYENWMPQYPQWMTINGYGDPADLTPDPGWNTHSDTIDALNNLVLTKENEAVNLVGESNIPGVYNFGENPYELRLNAYQNIWEEYTRSMGENPFDEAIQENYRETADHYTALASQWESLTSRGAAFLEDLQKAFLPNEKILFSDSSLGKALEQQTRVNWGMPQEVYGHSYGLRKSPGDDYLQIIEVNPEKIQRANGTFNEAMYFDVLAHEFGHALMRVHFNQAPEMVKKALWKAYSQWLEDVQTMSMKEFYRAYHPPGIAQREKGDLDNSLTVGEYLSPSYNRDFTFRRYLFSPSEFFAQQIAKWAGKSGPRTAMEKYFKRTSETYKRFYRRFGKEWQATEGVQAFLDELYAKSEYQQILDQRKAEWDWVPKGPVELVNNLNKKLSPKITGSAQKSESILDSATAEDLNEDLDTFNTLIKWGATLLQLGDLNQHIVGLQNYIGEMKNFWNTKMRWTERADRHLRQWNGQFKGAKRRAAFADFVYDATMLSDDKGRALTMQEKIELSDKYKLSDADMEFYETIQTDFKEALNRIEESLVTDAMKRLADNPVEQEAALVRIKRDFNQMRNRDYFPLSRFGKYTLMLKASEDMKLDGKLFKAGEVLSFEQFSTKIARDSKAAHYKKNMKKAIVFKDTLTDSFEVWQGMPPQMLEVLRDTLELQEDQYQKLLEYMHNTAPGQSFRKRLLHRKGIAGFDRDAKRSYANYFMHMSNHLARIQHGNALRDDIKLVEQSATELRISDPHKRRGIQEFLQGHYDYMMNPQNELANLRALGFIWYLGFVPKSAFINLTQVPLVTGPYLAARYGDIDTGIALTKAMKKISLMWKNPNVLSAGEREMISVLQQAGIIDESLATDIAAVAEGSILQRTAAGKFLYSEKAGTAIRRIGGMASYLFQQAEKVNRRITAVAAYDLAIKNGKSHQEAVALAREAVEKTQYEYARYNRPRFMQGKKSAFFLFWQYLQNTMYFLIKDPGRWRFLLAMFLLAGLEGLPGAEDILDLFDFIATKIKQHFGMKNPKMEARMEIRNFVKELTDSDPDWFMHGPVGRNLFGMFDISGSISMGRVVPGVEPIFGREGDFSERFSATTEDVGGAMVAVPMGVMRAATSSDPNELKNLERGLPSQLRNMLRAVRYGTEGETTRSGGQPEVFTFGDDPRSRAEIIGQALGFTPTRIAVEKEKQRMTREIVKYYEIRKRLVMQDLYEALVRKDSDLKKEALTAIKQYNETVPVNQMKITVGAVVRSMKNRLKQRALETKGIAPRISQYQIYKEVEEAFSAPESSESPSAPFVNPLE